MARTLTGDKKGTKMESLFQPQKNTIRNIFYIVASVGIIVAVRSPLLNAITHSNSTRYITYQDSKLHTVVPAWNFANLSDANSESLQFLLASTGIDNRVDIETKIYPGVGCPTMPNLAQISQDETDTMERAQFKPVTTTDWQVSDVTGLMLTGNTTKTIHNGGKSLQANYHESIAIFQNVCVTWRIYEFSDDSHRDQVHNAFLKVLNNISFTEHQTGS